MWLFLNNTLQQVKKNQKKEANSTKTCQLQRLESYVSLSEPMGAFVSSEKMNEVFATSENQWYFSLLRKGRKMSNKINKQK